MDDRKRYHCVNGPFYKTDLWLNTRSTAVFRCHCDYRDWHGRYVTDETNHHLVWEEIKL